MGVPEAEQPPVSTTTFAGGSEQPPPSYSATEGNSANPPTSLLDIGGQQYQQPPSPPHLESNTAVPDEAPPSYRLNLASEDANSDDLLQPVILVLAGQTIHAHKSSHVGPIPLLDPTQLSSVISSHTSILSAVPSPSTSANASSSLDETTVSPPLYQLSRGVAALGYQTPSVVFQRLEQSSKSGKQRPRHLYDLTLVHGPGMDWTESDYSQMLKSGHRSGWRGARGWKDGGGLRDCMFEMKSVSRRTVFGEPGKGKELGLGLRLWTRSGMSTAARGNGSGSSSVARYKATRVKKGDDTVGGKDVGHDQGMFEVGKLEDGRLEWRVESLFLPGQAEEHEEVNNDNGDATATKKGWKNRFFGSSSSSTADKARHVTAVAFEAMEEGQPRLVVMASLPRKIMDALVATWCLRLWMDSADQVEKSVSTTEVLQRGFRFAAEMGTNFGGPFGVGKLTG